MGPAGRGRAGRPRKHSSVRRESGGKRTVVRGKGEGGGGGERETDTTQDSREISSVGEGTLSRAKAYLTSRGFHESLRTEGIKREGERRA